MNITWNPLGGRHSHVIGLRIPPQRPRLANQKVRRSCDRAENEVIEAELSSINDHFGRTPFVK